MAFGWAIRLQPPTGLATPKEEPTADDGTVVLSGEEEEYLSTLIAQPEKD